MQGMGGDCGKSVVFLNSAVVGGHAEIVKLEQRYEGGQRELHAHSLGKTISSRGQASTLNPRQGRSRFSSV